MDGDSYNKSDTESNQVVVIETSATTCPNEDFSMDDFGLECDYKDFHNNPIKATKELKLQQKSTDDLNTGIDPTYLQVLREFEDIEESKSGIDIVFKKRITLIPEGIGNWQADEESASLRQEYSQLFADNDVDNDLEINAEPDTMSECGPCYLHTLEHMKEEMEERHQKLLRFQDKVTISTKRATERIRSNECDQMYLIKCNDKLLTSIAAIKKLEYQAGNISVSVTHRYGELQSMFDTQNVLQESLKTQEKQLLVRHGQLAVGATTLLDCLRKYKNEVEEAVKEASSLLNWDFSDLSLKSISTFLDEKSAELEKVMEDRSWDFVTK